MKRVDKKNILSKQQVLFCIFSVFLLALVLCGDFLVTRFLPTESNQEYFLENAFLPQVTLEEAVDLIRNEEQIYFLVGDKNMVSNTLKWESIYFIDRDVLLDQKNDSKKFQTILNDKNEIAFDNPMIYFFQKGVLQEFFEVKEQDF